MRNLTIIGKTCAADSCPTVYIDNDDKQQLAIQGYTVPEGKAVYPDGELGGQDLGLVEIPFDVFWAAVNNIIARDRGDSQNKG